MMSFKYPLKYSGWPRKTETVSPGKQGWYTKGRDPTAETPGDLGLYSTTWT